MKKTIGMMNKLYLILSVCILCCLFCSCKGTKQSAKQQQTVPELSYAAACDLFFQADDVFSWYYLGIMEVDTSQVFSNDSGRYYRCIDERLPENCDLVGLRQYLQNWFAKSYVASLLQEFGQFAENDGVLYAAGNGCGSNPLAGEARVSKSIERLRDTELQLTVLVEILGDDLQPTGAETTYHFKLIFEDQKWVFQNFEFVH
ncbi:MAG: hypothetical protein IKG89_06920 [Oscillospiraceae bacterium]|nr:hypothetical protein [Oscillospiraceae bacterium]